MNLDTALTRLGRASERFDGLVNAPVCRTSTYLYPTVAAFEAAAGNKHGSLYYGRFGNQTSKLLQDACCALDGGHEAMLFPSGLAAITRVLGALLQPGDHLLMVDSVYGPVRAFCEDELPRLGIGTSWYAPQDLAGARAAVRDTTRLIYCESPGSMTFELQDIRGLAELARASGLISVIDNTWATPYLFRPLEHGIDIAIQSASKYLSGHSDVMLGVAVANDGCRDVLRRSAASYGNSVSADDCYLTLRGMRTLGVRMARHQQGALQLAHWLSARPEVAAVHHPGLPESPDHALWLRDFDGASGLFAIEFAVRHDAAEVHAFVDALQMFGIGASWGGFESLALPALHLRRNFEGRVQGPVVRFSIGLEDPQELIEDLERALVRTFSPSR